MDKRFSFPIELEYSAKLIGGSSFVIGTLLFVLALIDKKNDALYMFGLYFIIGVFTVNTFMFLLLIICANIFKTKRRRLQITAAKLLLNAPIAFLYVIIIISHS